MCGIYSAEQKSDLTYACTKKKTMPPGQLTLKIKYMQQWEWKGNPK